MSCKNCNTSLKETDDFCNVCGAKIIRNRLTIKNLFEHFSEHFLNYDNRFFQTFISLFSKPEVVIDGYINGVRKKYVNVVSYFAIALSISGLYIFVLNKFFPELLTLDSIYSNGMEQFSSDIMSTLMEYSSILMMLNVPIYAFLSKLTFYRNKKYNYTEHLVIFMYVLAQTTLVSSVVTILAAFAGVTFESLSILTVLFQFFYAAFCLKRLFNLSFKGIILRSLLFLIFLIITYILSIIIFTVGLIVIQPEYFEKMMEAQKTKST